MAKKKTAASDTEGDPSTTATPPEAPMTTDTTSAPTSANDENVSAYFKDLLRDRLELLEKRSNEEIYDMWLQDHPGYSEVPENVRAGLSNVKSILRKEYNIKGPKKTKGKGGRKPRAASPAMEDNGSAAPARAVKAVVPTKDLETLEELLDEAVQAARKIGGKEMDTAVRYLRQARIQVGLKLGL